MKIYQKVAGFVIINSKKKKKKKHHSKQKKSLPLNPQFFLQMCAPMHFQHIGLPKSLAALLALERLLIGVDLHVSLKTARSEEAFAALGAGVGPNPRVVPGVQLQVAGLCEALVTV